MTWLRGTTLVLFVFVRIQRLYASVIHFNQILEVASGEYFALTCDDDEISSNYISNSGSATGESPGSFDRISRQEIMNEDSVVIRKSKELFQRGFSLESDFVRGLWQTFEFGFEAIGTFVARTAKVVECGGYPDFVRGSGIDNALVIKLCLDSMVALSPECVWRWRVHESGYGWAMSRERPSHSAYTVHAISR